MSVKDNLNDKPSALKTTREAKGLTLEIVHEATKIPMDALKAIEEGYSSRILSPFYYRGFIKIYAEFLGLDIGEMYKQYGLDQPSKPATVQPASGKTVLRENRPNVFLEQAQEGAALVFKPKNIKVIVKIAGFVLVLFVLVKMAGCAAAHLHKKAASAKRPVYAQQERPSARQESDGEEKTPAAAAPGVVKHQSVQAQSDDDKVEVAVRAMKDTWIQVKADDKVVFQMTLNKGAMESWSADKHIQLSGRDIEQLDMEVNGKHIGSLGEHRIRKVMITKEGLTVKK